jgi:hypothetical protein
MRVLPAFCALPFTTTSTQAVANPFSQGNSKIGKRLFDGTRYNSCHMSITASDGSGIFMHPDRIVASAAALKRICFCETQADTRWTPTEEIHVAAFLNQTYYHFP